MMIVNLASFEQTYIERLSKFSLKVAEKVDSIFEVSSHLDVNQITELSCVETTYSLFGRIYSLRKHSRIIFLSLGRNLIQLSISCEHELFADFERMVIGDMIWVTGSTFVTSAGVLSLNIASLERLTLNVHKLQNLFYSSSFETSGERNYTLSRLCSSKMQNILSVKSKLLSCTRQTLEGKGFVEVFTPILQLQKGTSLAKQFRSFSNEEGKDVYLRIAQEVYLKRLVVSGIHKVFELGPNFRNEAYSPNHFSEFYTLEAYLVNARRNDVVKVILDIITNIIDEFKSSFPNFQLKVEKVEPKELVLASEFERIAEISLENFLSDKFNLGEFCRLKGIAEQDSKFDVMVELVEQNLPSGLVVLKDLPNSQTLLARPVDEYFSESCDIFIDGIEIATVFTENTDPLNQLERMKLANLGIEETLLGDLFLGMPALAGFGIGMERLLKQLLGLEHIRDCLSFQY